MRSPVSCAPLRYVPHVHGLGDRYTVTLAYPDEPALRSAAAPLGLELAADLRLGDAYLAGPGLWVEAFGPCVSLLVGPEDAYELLEAADHERAATLARGLREGGASDHVVEPFPPNDRGAFTASFSPAHAWLGQHELAVRERNGDGHLLRAHEVKETPASAALEQLRPVLETMDIPLPLAGAEESERSLSARIVVARDGLSPETLGTPMAIVGAALTFLRDMHVPCLFDARRAVLEDRTDLFAFVLGELNRGLTAANDPRRYARVGAGPDAATYVAMTDAERSLLGWPPADGPIPA